MRTVSFRECNPKHPWNEWYIYLHLVDLDGVGKYIVRPMDPMGGGMCWVRPPLRIPVIARSNQGVRMVPPPALWCGWRGGGGSSSSSNNNSTRSRSSIPHKNTPIHFPTPYKLLFQGPFYKSSIWTRLAFYILSPFMVGGRQWIGIL